MGIFKSVECRKCGQEEESSYQVPYSSVPALAWHRMEFYGPISLQLIDNSRALIKMILALDLWSELFKGL
jgi:hypothetical protein